MYISPVSLGSSSPMVGAMWAELLRPKQDTLFDAIQSNNSIVSTKPTDIFSIINRQQVYSLEERERAGFLQLMFLQFGNKIVKDLAMTIVNRSDSSDIKAQKLQRWVAENITYKLDSEEYGKDEVWQPPVITISKGTGDCEDQALLLHSLMLNAGIQSTNIRTYGGLVDDGMGTSGGHAWTAYNRQYDNEWVILDTTFYPDLSSITSMPLMKNSEMYQDDFFFMTLSETVFTTATDRIHNPDIMPIYGRTGVQDNNINRQPGMWLNAYA